MRKILLIALALFFIFQSKSFAVLEFKQSKDISSDTDHLRGVTFKPDGSRMYVTADEDDPVVLQYSLTTPFDISTATKIGSGTELAVSEGGNLDKPHAIEFKPDGKVMYVIRSESGTVGVEQYNLTTAWDTSTIDHDTRKIINGAGDCSTNIQIRALAFKSDGTRMFVSQEGAEVVSQYDLTTAWDVSSATNNVCSNSFGAEESDMRNIQFSSDGTIMYLGGSNGDDINKYTLATAWDVTAISHVTTYSISSQTGNMRGFKFTANFTKLYVTGDDGSSTGDNVVYEYNMACSGTITCSDPSNNNDVKAIIEANVELSKRIIKHNTLSVFHRIEWLRRHKNKDNLTNLNAEVNFSNEVVSSLARAVGSYKKERKRDYDSDEWFQWTEGRVSVGKRKGANSSLRDVRSNGISIGADKIKKEDRDTMYGYVLQHGNDNIDIGVNGTKLVTESYSFAMYGTKLRENHFFTDGIIGVSLLDIDHKRITYGNTLKGNREGQQIFGSINLGKRLHDEEKNLNPGIKLDLGYTRLKAFREKTILGDSLADALLYKEQKVKSALATIGVLLDTTDKEEKKQEEKIINHHGRLEYIVDLSPSSNTEFYYLNSESTVYKFKADNKAEHNYRIGYGFDVTSISGWSVVTNFERFGTKGKGYSNEFYLSLGYVPIDEKKFLFNFDNSNHASLAFTNNVNGFDLKINTDYNFFSNLPQYSANISITDSF